MKKYIYTGVIPWVASIRYHDGDKWTVMDVNMSKDDEKDLPADTASVRWMVASGNLKLVNVDPKQTPK